MILILTLSKKNDEYYRPPPGLFSSGLLASVNQRLKVETNCPAIELNFLKVRKPVLEMINATI